jgi:hypothetical protein
MITWRAVDFYDYEEAQGARRIAVRDVGLLG